MSGTEIEQRYSAMRILTLMHTSILQITFVPKYQMNNVRHGRQDASKPTRNGFVHLLRETQKPTEGTDLKHPTTLGANQMAKVTYRGVQYDTETRQKETKQSQKQLVYRGVAVQGAK